MAVNGQFERLFKIDTFIRSRVIVTRGCGADRETVSWRAATPHARPGLSDLYRVMLTCFGSDALEDR